MRWYIGLTRPCHYEAFKSDKKPTERTHGTTYRYCVGPFKTKRNAQFAAKNAYGPCLQTVSDFERAAKEGK